MRIINGAKPRRFKRYQHWWNNITKDDIRVMRVQDITKGLFSTYLHSKITFSINDRYYFFETDDWFAKEYLLEELCLDHFHALLREAKLK